MLFVFTIMLIIVGALLFVKHDTQQKRKALEKAFTGRESLSKEDFYQRFFEETGIPRNVVIGVRDVLEEKLSVDLSKLDSTDDFSKNLAFFWEHDSMADVEIVCALEERFSIIIENKEAEKMCTVEEIIRVVHEKSRRII